MDLSRIRLRGERLRANIESAVTNGIARDELLAVPPNAHQDDATLLADPSPEAFAVVYRRYARTVVRYCARRGLDAHAAADVTAETFIDALRNRDRYDPDAGEARSWLLGICRHKIADRARRATRDESLEGELQRVALTQRDLSDYAALQTAVEGEASDALERLPADQQMAIKARVIDDQGYDEIARRAGVSEGAIRTRISRGLATLSTRLKEKNS